MNMENSLDNHLRAYEGNLEYDFDNEILLTWYPKRILDLVGERKSLLELGLGHGYSTELFAKHFRKHVVVDGSKAIIRNFQKKFPECKAQIVESFFETFETQERFDLVVMGFVLEHVDDPVQILSHFRKFLTPEGRLFLAVPNAESLNRRVGHLAGLLPDMGTLSDNDHLLGHKRYYTTCTLTEDVIKAGYSVKRMEGIFLKPLTTYQMVSLNLDKKLIQAFCEVGICYPELCCGILAELQRIP